MSIVGIFTSTQPAFGAGTGGPGLVFDATLEESTELNTDVTEYPVESGVVGNDHAVQRPMRITMRIGMSDNAFRALKGAAGTAASAAASIGAGTALGQAGGGAAVAAGLGATALSAGFNAGQAATRSQQALDNLRELQRKQEIIDVVGVRQTYENVLISSTRQETTKKNEEGVEIVVEMTKLIIAESPSGGAPVPAVNDSAATQAMPAANLGVVSPQ